MYQIICPQCSNVNNFDSLEKRPVECSFCFTGFTVETPYQEIPNEIKGKLIGLKLIYQQNSESIIIEGDSTVLGREHAGSELFSNILFNQKQVISRKHCSIFRKDDKFYLKDEGSTNGTFYGVNKIDCSKEAREIENNTILFLGREAFLVQFICEEKKVNKEEHVFTNENEAEKTHKYRCKEGCGFETDTYQEICPKCMAINSLVSIG